MPDIVIRVENLSKQYRLGQIGSSTIREDINRFWAKMRGKDDPTLKISQTNALNKIRNSEFRIQNSDYIWALKDINFEVKQGEVLGIIGKNGAGKSTLLKILSKVTTPTTGQITVTGRIGSLLEVGTGFHPELSGRENIFLNGAILGMTKTEIRSKFDEIVDFSGVEKYLDTPVKRYSSGMYVRLAFAVAAHLEPEILIVDEVLAVGDAEFQKKAIGKMQNVSRDQGRTVLFVSHNMSAIESLCNKVIHIKQGVCGSVRNDVRKVIQEYLFGENPDNQNIEFEFGNKYDDKTFALKRIYVTNINGHKISNNAFSPSEAILVNIEGTLNKFDNRLRIGFELKNSENELLFYSFNRDENENSELISLGLHRFSAIIPAHFLNEGEYYLHPFVDIYHLEGLNDPQNEFIRFKIQGNMSDSHYYTHARPGTLAPILKWNISEQLT